MSSNWNHAEISRNDIACSLIRSTKDWIPEPNDLEYVVEYFGLDPDEWEIKTTADAIKLQQLWVSRMIAEYTELVYKELKKNEQAEFERNRA